MKTNSLKYGRRQKKKNVERTRLMQLARAGNVKAIKKLEKKYKAKIKT